MRNEWGMEKINNNDGEMVNIYNEQFSAWFLCHLEKK